MFSVQIIENQPLTTLLKMSSIENLQQFQGTIQRLKFSERIRDKSILLRVIL